MLFSELVSSMQRELHHAQVVVSPDWLQGRAIFGGLQAALALHAMRALVPNLPLRSLQVTFISPPSSSQLQFETHILRQSKHTVHVQTHLLNGAQLLGIVIAIFGLQRPSEIQIIPAQPFVDPSQGMDFLYQEGLFPAFIQHFQARWLKGGLPFSGSTSTQSCVQVSLNDENTSICHEEHVLLFADFIPPIGLSMVSNRANGSSLTWMLDILVDNFSDLTLRNWRIDAQLLAAHQGYTSQTLTLWGSNGNAIALGRQNMMVFG